MGKGLTITIPFFVSLTFTPYGRKQRQSINNTRHDPKGRKEREDLRCDVGRILKRKLSSIGQSLRHSRVFLGIIYPILGTRDLRRMVRWKMNVRTKVRKIRVLVPCVF